MSSDDDIEQRDDHVPLTQICTIPLPALVLLTKRTSPLVQPLGFISIIKVILTHNYR